MYIVFGNLQTNICCSYGFGLHNCFTFGTEIFARKKIYKLKNMRSSASDLLADIAKDSM